MGSAGVRQAGAARDWLGPLDSACICRAAPAPDPGLLEPFRAQEPGKLWDSD